MLKVQCHRIRQLRPTIYSNRDRGSQLTPPSSALELSGAEATAANIMAPKMKPDLTARAGTALSQQSARLVIQVITAPVL